MKNPFEDFYEKVNKQFKVFDKIANPSKHFTKLIELPRIELPRIKLPKIQFPEIRIDYDKIEKVIENNASFGWTLSGQMNANFYLNEELLDKDQEYIDSWFVEYFEGNSRKNFYLAIEDIKELVDDHWKNVINDCFELYETDKYRIIIPMLITIIEGEISKIAESQKVGYPLMKDWKKQIDTEEDRFMVIVSFSLQNYLSNNMFVRKEFTEDRGTVLNRNWVLHGRDNPELWTRTDALKLINIIATLQFIQN